MDNGLSLNQWPQAPEGNRLNERQQAAVRHKDGPMMVVAGPGSGKTTVITHRIDYLIQVCRVPPREILVITFTKAASEEMRRRFLRISGATRSDVTFATFHSFFFTVIRQCCGYTLENVLSEDAKREVIRSILRTLAIGFDEGDDFIQQMTNEISMVKNELIDIRYHNPIDLAAEAFRDTARLYEQWKQKNNKLDFDDMLSKCYAVITENSAELARWRRRYRYIMIDEFQDINRVQYETMKLFAQPLNNFFVVGDDDQSIYRFRGSRPEFLLHMRKDFPALQSVILNVNYRSTDPIITYCNRVIQKNKNRFKKEIQGTRCDGLLPVLLRPADNRQEALMIAQTVARLKEKVDLNDIAVVYRTNNQSRPLIDVFMDLHIPFRVKDDAPGIYEHWLSKDICAYFRLALDKDDNLAFERIANKPKRYFSKAALALARKQGGALITNLYRDKRTPVWQLPKLEELMFSLDALRERTPYEAFRYVRQAVGYDDYVREYAAYRKMNDKGLFEVLAELQDAAKPSACLADYLTHIDAVVLKTRSDRDRKKRTGDDRQGVVFSTMHGVKGLEYDTVFVTGVVEGLMPYEKSKTEPELAEECRMLYVAMTRARRRLFVSACQIRNDTETVPSRFLDGIEPHCFTTPQPVR